jgi:hypothetical protein
MTPCGTNFMKIASLNGRLLVRNRYLDSTISLTLGTVGHVDVTDARQGGSSLIPLSAAALSAVFNSLSKKTLGLTPGTAYSCG